MAILKAGQHPFADGDLITGAELSRLLGVSQPRVSQVVAEQSGRLDQFLNSKGSLRYHPEISVRQWHERKVVSKVSTPTQAQAAAGIGNLGAQAVAHRMPATVPTGDIRGDERELALSRSRKEMQNVRLLELKVLEKEGKLVDKSLFYQKAHILMAAVKDQLNALPPQIAPGIVAHIEECLTSFGMTDEQAREIIIKGSISHIVRESIRQGIVRSMRELSTKSVEELLGA